MVFVVFPAVLLAEENLDATPCALDSIGVGRAGCCGSQCACNPENRDHGTQPRTTVFRQHPTSVWKPRHVVFPPQLFFVVRNYFQEMFHHFSARKWRTLLIPSCGYSDGWYRMRVALWEFNRKRGDVGERNTEKTEARKRKPQQRHTRWWAKDWRQNCAV